MTNYELELIYNELIGVLKKHGFGFDCSDEKCKSFSVSIILTNGVINSTYSHGNNDYLLSTLLQSSTDVDAMPLFTTLLDFLLLFLNRDFMAGDEFIQRLLAVRRETLNAESEETKVVPLN